MYSKHTCENVIYRLERSCYLFQDEHRFKKFQISLFGDEFCFKMATDA